MCKSRKVIMCLSSSYGLFSLKSSVSSACNFHETTTIPIKDILVTGSRCGDSLSQTCSPAAAEVVSGQLPAVSIFQLSASVADSHLVQGRTPPGAIYSL